MFAKLKEDFRLRYAILLILGAIGYLFFYFSPSSSEDLLLCPFKTITGIPCPACGSTRATILLFKGEFEAAFWLNPLVYITHSLALAIGIWMVKDILTHRETFFPFLRRKWSWYILLPILLLLAFNMWWNYIKGL